MQGLHSVRLVLLDRVMNDAWIAWNPDGRIHGFGQGRAPAGLTHGGGAYVAPGFVDLHVHGGNGADFLDGTVDAFLTASEFHLAGGTTALAPTLATAPYEKIKAVRDVFETARSRARGRLLGLHLEGPHLNPSKAGAQDPALMTPPTAGQIQWVVDHTGTLSQMTIAPEFAAGLDMIEQGSRAGVRMSLGHTEAREEEARAAIARGATKVTHLFNAMTYAGKAGILRQPGLAEYALTEDALACELIADGYHASLTFLKLAYRMKGARRLALISDALAGTGLPKGTHFQLGRLRCVVGDQVCLLEDGSALAGSATRLIDQVRRMVTTVGVPVPEAVCMASYTPARLLGLEEELGLIAEGRAANLVRFDETFRVLDVFTQGMPVSARLSQQESSSPLL